MLLNISHFFCSMDYRGHYGQKGSWMQDSDCWNFLWNKNRTGVYQNVHILHTAFFPHEPMFLQLLVINWELHVPSYSWAINVHIHWLKFWPNLLFNHFGALCSLSFFFFNNTTKHKTFRTISLPVIVLDSRQSRASKLET